MGAKPTTPYVANAVLEDSGALVASMIEQFKTLNQMFEAHIAAVQPQPRGRERQRSQGRRGKTPPRGLSSARHCHEGIELASWGLLRVQSD